MADLHQDNQLNDNPLQSSLIKPSPKFGFGLKLGQVQIVSEKTELKPDLISDKSACAEDTMSKNMVAIEKENFSILERIGEESKQEVLSPPKAPKLKPKYKLS